jgi:hypothetical protein
MATSKQQPNEITEIDEVIDPGGDDITFDDLEHGEVATTDSFHQLNNVHETVDEIIDMGVETLDPEATTHIVRVHTDVGPVYYGDTNRPIELKKNRRYQVPTHVHRYLLERGLLVDQIADYQG